MKLYPFFVEGTYISKAQWDYSLNRFAELLSDDVSLDDIAERMSITRGTSCALLHKLDQMYGGDAR